MLQRQNMNNLNSNSKSPHDTRNIEDIKARFKIQSVALNTVHNFMHNDDMIQLMPVILSKYTDPLGPDPGSSVIKTGEIEYQGQTLQLTQSMILHKQFAIGSGLERFYIMSPNVRLEAAHRYDSGRHAFEFTQIDFEIKNAKMNEIFKLVEQLLRQIRNMVEKKCSEELLQLNRTFSDWGDDAFPIYSTHELQKKYGENWEELSSKDASSPFWITCHDREFYDKKDRSKDGEHFLNYDLCYPEGFGEGLSGAERESDFDSIRERLIEDKLLDQYSEFLELAKNGKVHPSAGAGIGVERLLRYLTGTKHIKDVQLFIRVPGKLVEL